MSSTKYSLIRKLIEICQADGRQYNEMFSGSLAESKPQETTLLKMWKNPGISGYFTKEYLIAKTGIPEGQISEILDSVTEILSIFLSQHLPIAFNRNRLYISELLLKSGYIEDAGILLNEYQNDFFNSSIFTPETSYLTDVYNKIYWSCLHLEYVAQKEEGRTSQIHSYNELAETYTQYLSCTPETFNTSISIPNTVFKPARNNSNVKIKESTYSLIKSNDESIDQFQSAYFPAHRDSLTEFKKRSIRKLKNSSYHIFNSYVNWSFSGQRFDYIYDTYQYLLLKGYKEESKLLAAILLKRHSDKIPSSLRITIKNKIIDSLCNSAQSKKERFLDKSIFDYRQKLNYRLHIFSKIETAPLLTVISNPEPHIIELLNPDANIIEDPVSIYLTSLNSKVLECVTSSNHQLVKFNGILDTATEEEHFSREESRIIFSYIQTILVTSFLNNQEVKVPLELLLELYKKQGEFKLLAYGRNLSPKLLKNIVVCLVKLDMFTEAKEFLDSALSEYVVGGQRELIVQWCLALMEFICKNYRESYFQSKSLKGRLSDKYHAINNRSLIIRAAYKADMFDFYFIENEIESTRKYLAAPQSRRELNQVALNQLKSFVNGVRNLNLLANSGRPSIKHFNNVVKYISDKNTLDNDWLKKELKLLVFQDRMKDFFHKNKSAYNTIELL